MPIIEYGGRKPTIGSGTFIMASATLIGDVVVGSDVLIMSNVVLRADYTRIVIGDRVVILEDSVLNPTLDEPITIEGDSVIGYGARIHGGDIKMNVFVGMNSVLMHGVKVGEHSYIGACSILPANTHIPPRSVVMGAPGRVVREAGKRDMGRIEFAVGEYMKTLQRYRVELSEWELRHNA